MQDIERTHKKYKIVTRKSGKIVSRSVKAAASVTRLPTLSECLLKNVDILLCVEGGLGQSYS